MYIAISIFIESFFIIYSLITDCSVSHDTYAFLFTAINNQKALDNLAPTRNL
jgi:hypothetical protein